MNEDKKKWGGKREGAGRKKGNNDITISVKITPENKEWLDKQGNKTRYINALLERERTESVL